MDKNYKLYSRLAKDLVSYTDEPSKYKKKKMLCSLNGRLGAMKKNGYDKEAIALQELRKIFKRIK